MIERLQQFLEARYGITEDDLRLYGQRALVSIAALTFIVVASIIVAFDSIFLRVNSGASLELGGIANRTINAPSTITYTSAVLTDRAREEARNAVQPIYSPPSLTTVRTWDQRAEQTIDFIDDVRAAGRYDRQEQQLADLSHMEYLTFSNPENAPFILALDDDVWNTIVAEVDDVIELVYRDPIIDATNYIATQLTIQISPAFDDATGQLIFDIVDDFVKPNITINLDATEAARTAAADAVPAVEITYVSGQNIVNAGDPIDDIAFESLQQFGLLAPQESTTGDIIRALIANTITLVIFGLYIARFSPDLLYKQVRRLTIVAVIFLITLALARLLGTGSGGNIYLFPAAALGLLFVAIADAHVAVIATLGLSFLIGLIDTGNSLEITSLIAAGGIMGIMGLRRAGRLNQFFVAGGLIGITNAAIVILFNFPSGTALDSGFLPALALSLVSGLLLAPATAMAAMYAVTMLFNMPTALKLIDLQQPNKPLLQRLLRDAPGTYQHSLQVGNLAEQAANAIGADAQLTHVAALYHDIGKMANPLYFTENQQDMGGNPHDTINDPYRSADIIISHVTEGDEMAKQAGLPQRIRDFIREHHGTTSVYVFHQRALKAVDGDETAVDLSDFTYPGPKPRSKETAILMLADSCEAAVRSIKPESKQAIRQLVANIIEGKRKDGQLDESGLTLNDLSTILEIFVDILQGMFHPRINYREAVNKKPDTPEKTPVVSNTNGASQEVSVTRDTTPKSKKSTQTTKIVEEKLDSAPPVPSKLKTMSEETAIADEEPLAEVPRLPSLDERKSPGVESKSGENGKPNSQSESDRKEGEK